MKYFFRIFSFLVFIVISFSTVSQSYACVATGRGTANTRYISNDGYEADYTVHSKNVLWNLEGFGWHASGLLACEDCFGARRIEGVYFLTDKYLFVPESAKLRIERDLEIFSTSRRVVGGKGLRAIDSGDAVKLGEFVGYYVLYNVSLKNAEQLFLLVLNMNDGCAFFDTVLPLETLPKFPEKILGSIFSDLSFEKKIFQRTNPNSSKSDFDAAVRKRKLTKDGIDKMIKKMLENAE